MYTGAGCSFISTHVYWYWVHHYFITCILVQDALLFLHMCTGTGAYTLKHMLYWHHISLHVNKLAQGAPSFHYRCSSTGAVLLQYMHHTCTDTVCTCVLVLGEATFCHMSTDTGCSSVHHMCNIFLITSTRGVVLNRMRYYYYYTSRLVPHQCFHVPANVDAIAFLLFLAVQFNDFSNQMFHQRLLRYSLCIYGHM
jgi:hypothetical protein